VVCVFTRKISEPLTSLVKQIDQKIGENSQLKSFVVVMTKQPSVADDLAKLAKDASVKHIPLTMYGEPGGPPDYELSKDADITVLMWKNHKVKVNHAFKGELTDRDVHTILADIPKVLGD
jgi:hypothetical protein